MTLRDQIYGEFPYKDVRNSRKITIDISNIKNQIKISHIKSEQTTDNLVEFDWQATFTISKYGSKNMYLEISDLCSFVWSLRIFGLLWYLKHGDYSSVKSHLLISRFVLAESIHRLFSKANILFDQTRYLANAKKPIPTVGSHFSSRKGWETRCCHTCTGLFTVLYLRSTIMHSNSNNRNILQGVELENYSEVLIRLPQVAKAVPLQTALHYLSNALAKVIS